MGDEVTLMVLKMDRMFPQMARTHYFVATNEHGTGEHGVKIERDASQEVLIGSAQHQAALPILVTCLIAMFGYFAH